MLYIHVTCDEPECTADVVVRLTGQQMFESTTVRQAISKAWKIYKPKYGPATAKCPDHWTPMPRKKRTHPTMSDPVPTDQIEGLVGATRDPVKHIGRLRSEDHRIYILHSEKCLGRYDDLRECPFSVAMDRGLRDDDWAEFWDKAVSLAIRLDNGPARLVPADLVH